MPIFEMGAQVKKLPNKKVEEKTAKIVDDINNRRHMQARASLVIRVITAQVSRMMDSPGKTARKYIVNDRCNKCGICAKVCPAENIAVTEKVRFADKCEYCLACPHLCPQNAIHLKNERSDKRWINPEVSLNEIIMANNRGT